MKIFFWFRQISFTIPAVIPHSQSSFKTSMFWMVSLQQHRYLLQLGLAKITKITSIAMRVAQMVTNWNIWSIVMMQLLVSERSNNCCFWGNIGLSSSRILSLSFFWGERFVIRGQLLSLRYLPKKRIKTSPNLSFFVILWMPYRLLCTISLSFLRSDGHCVKWPTLGKMTSLL